MRSLRMRTCLELVHRRLLNSLELEMQRILEEKIPKQGLARLLKVRLSTDFGKVLA